jgi:hypothetical protein
LFLTEADRKGEEGGGVVVYSVQYRTIWRGEGVIGHEETSSFKFPNEFYHINISTCDFFEESGSMTQKIGQKGIL